MYKFLRTALLSVTVALCCMAPYSSTAQEGSVDVNAGFGLISIHQISIALSSEKGQIVADHASGVFSASGKYFLTDRLAVGMCITLQSIDGRSNDSWVSAGSRYSFSFHMLTTTIAPELTANYGQAGAFTVYSLFGIAYQHNFTSMKYAAGGGNNNYTINPNTLSLQYTPLGIKIGNTISGFLEIGIGYKGLICAGAVYSID